MSTVGGGEWWTSRLGHCASGEECPVPIRMRRVPAGHRDPASGPLPTITMNNWCQEYRSVCDSELYHALSVQLETIWGRAASVLWWMCVKNMMNVFALDCDMKRCADVSTHLSRIQASRRMCHFYVALQETACLQHLGVLSAASITVGGDKRWGE